MNKKELEYLGTLTEDQIIELAEALELKVPEDISVNDSAMDKLKESIVNNLESQGQTVESYLKSMEVVEEKPKKTKKSRKEEKDDLSQLTFGKLARLGQEEKEESVEKRAMKLKRCMISCNNQDKRNWQGEIFTVQNSLISKVEKFIPFNVVTHIPTILYNVIKERKLQIFYDERVNGRKVTKSRLVNEFNIQDLPPISSQELEAIKKKQLAEASV